MSAFIVSTDCMHRVVDAIMEDHRRNSEPFAGIPKESPDAADMIGRQLFQLNRRAVLDRYPGDEEYAAVPAYSHHPLRASKVARFKAIRCLLYQCSEGDVPESPIFKQLEDVSWDLAYTIISELPEWECADWG
jgi:hypothetical protein